MSAALLLAAALAAAPGGVARNSLSVRPFELTSHGLGVEYERYLPGHALSLAVGPEGRAEASGDFHALQLGVGVEARLWLFRSIAPPRAPPGPMAGPYLGARLDGSFTRLVASAGSRRVGTDWGALLAVGLGWRFALGPVHLTPSAAAGLQTDAGGALAPGARGTFILGLALGWLF